jgi:hypothetical protein
MYDEIYEEGYRDGGSAGRDYMKKAQFREDFKTVFAPLFCDNHCKQLNNNEEYEVVYNCIIRCRFDPNQDQGENMYFYIDMKSADFGIEIFHPDESYRSAYSDEHTIWAYSAGESVTSETLAYWHINEIDDEGYFSKKIHVEKLYDEIDIIMIIGYTNIIAFRFCPFS